MQLILPSTRIPHFSCAKSTRVYGEQAHTSACSVNALAVYFSAMQNRYRRDSGSRLLAIDALPELGQIGCLGAEGPEVAVIEANLARTIATATILHIVILAVIVHIRTHQHAIVLADRDADSHDATDEHHSVRCLALHLAEAGISQAVEVSAIDNRTIGSVLDLHGHSLVDSFESQTKK
jgi:hypothetical protein